jgi:opacity protein-like surface antigen
MFYPNTRLSVLVSAVGGLCLFGHVASAENLFSLYGGSSFTRNSALHVTQPARSTDLTLHDVEWGASPLKAAPYYGLRLTHFYDRHPNWGMALDFTHYKMYAKTARVIPVDGVWQGTSVQSAASMDSYVQHFEISHGVNVLSVNGIYRWLAPGLAGGRLQPYAGAGLAYYWPHSENTVGGIAHETGYAASGFGYQVLGGLHYRLSERIGAFVEAKFNSGTATVDIADGQAETSLRTLHAIVGVSASF